ncbi:coiled-coil domain-containing protein 170 [Erinaceus europaeus]|uniref:Coiled-coil domain-containing protein 170 n=1 Tax=Erinaceus europaeus TaxID=9365 RepID=A0ABM3YJ72_ERIEU|nr:coiled-coil domain-containing protein 170 [Erinaceus europaeus]
MSLGGSPSAWRLDATSERASSPPPEELAVTVTIEGKDKTKHLQVCRLASERLSTRLQKKRYRNYREQLSLTSKASVKIEVHMYLRRGILVPFGEMPQSGIDGYEVVRSWSSKSPVSLKMSVVDKRIFFQTLPPNRFAEKTQCSPPPLFCLFGGHYQETYDPLLEASAIREQLNHYRNVAENAHSELAAALVKFECAQSELRDLRSKLLTKEASCQELKAEVESYKENNARKSSLLTSLRERVQELEEESAALSTSKVRSDIAVHNAIKENQELKRKVGELHEKLQKCLRDNEETKNQASESCRKHEEFLAHLRDSLAPDKKNEEAVEEDLILKLRELCKEHASAKGQIVTLEEVVDVHEMEAKASRETIMRLASEVSREQKKAASWMEEKEKLNQDWLSAVEAKEAIEREVKALRERLLAGQRVWDASKQELSLLKKSSCELEKSLKASLDAASAMQNQYSSFREKIIALLRGSLGGIGSTEDAVLERIRELGIQEESRKRMVSQLEAQISELVEQLRKETGFHQKALQRAQKAENKLETLQGQLTHLEGELDSGDVLRDNLNVEKQKYLKFLDQLSEKMKLDQMAAELGFDMRLDMVLARTEQLVRLESNVVIENKTITHNLQRKLKLQRERLESKELHMNLLRQKIAQLEQEKQMRTHLAVERDEANLSTRKLQKKVERLQKELSECRDSNTELKAKLADTNELKIKTLEQTQTIEGLNKSRDKLEKMKEKAEKQLMSVKSELDTTEREAREKKKRADSMLQVVTSEANTLRKALEEAEKREKQPQLPALYLAWAMLAFKEPCLQHPRSASTPQGFNLWKETLSPAEIKLQGSGSLNGKQWHSELLAKQTQIFVPCACLKDATIGRERHSEGHLKLLN